MKLALADFIMIVKEAVEYKAGLDDDVDVDTPDEAENGPTLHVLLPSRGQSFAVQIWETEQVEEPPTT